MRAGTRTPSRRLLQWVFEHEDLPPYRFTDPARFSSDMFQDEGAVLIAEHLRPLLDQADAGRERLVPTATSPA